MNEKRTHLAKDWQEAERAFTLSFGLNQPKNIKSLCGKTVSILSIVKSCPTCESCNDEWIQSLDAGM